MKIIELTGTTAADGSLTLTADSMENGFLEKVVSVHDDAAATADFTITNESAVSEAILTKTDQAQADAVWYPRTLANKIADASAFTDVAEKIFVTGKFKVVVAQGGNAATVRFLIYLSDE